MKTGLPKCAGEKGQRDEQLLESQGRSRLHLAELVRPPAVHAHTFDTSNADNLDADIIAAVLPIGKRHELSRRCIQVIAVADEVGHLGCG